MVTIALVRLTLIVHLMAIQKTRAIEIASIKGAVTLQRNTDWWENVFYWYAARIK